MKAEVVEVEAIKREGGQEQAERKKFLFTE
jgi:hypothetical protein